MNQCAMYDFSSSDFTLMIGGQVLLLVVILMVFYFGLDGSSIDSFPRKQMQNMIAATSAVVASAALPTIANMPKATPNGTVANMPATPNGTPNGTPKGTVANMPKATPTAQK